jgi:hypothetical protein
MARLPDTGPSFARRVRRMERQLVRQRDSSAFVNSGLAPVGGNETQVVGGLLFAPGSIGNDALASPTVPTGVNIVATNFAPSTTWTEVAGVDLSVPDGASQLVLYATAWVYAINNTAAADDLHVRVVLGATTGQEFLNPLGVGGYGTTPGGLVTVPTGLTSGTVLHLAVQTKTTTGAFTAATTNTANLIGTATWLR